MEGKRLTTPFGTLLLGVLILCLVAAQTQVDAAVCCQGPWGRTCYITCSLSPLSPLCTQTCGCVSVSGACPPGYPSISPLKNSAEGTVHEYCKFGCASSTCNAIISNLQNSGAQVVKEVMDQCNIACSELCTKDSTIALETA